ncbi:HTH-type transcriptional repressor Bm3R1 [compost metagenome]
MSYSDPNQDLLPQRAADRDTPCGRREERDVEYRNRILTTALGLFNKYGIEAVTMYQIAQEAGVGQGTLYRRYADVGEVCSDLLHTTTVEFLDSLERGLKDYSSETAALSQLADMIIRMIDFVDDKASLLLAINKTRTHSKKNFSLHQKPVYIRLHHVIAPIVARAVSQGEIHPLDVTLTVNTLITSLSPEQYLYHREILAYTKESFAEGMCRLFAKGM